MMGSKRIREVIVPPKLAEGEGAKTVYLPTGSKWVSSFSPNTPIEAISTPETSALGGIYRFHVVRYKGVLDNYRSELRGKDAGLTNNIPNNIQFNVGFTLHVPPDWLPDTHHEIIWQLHATEDPAEAGLSSHPPLSLRIINNKFYVQLYHSTSSVSYQGKDLVTIPASSQFGIITAGNSYAIAISYKLSGGNLGTGNFSISLDGTPQYSYSGPLAYDDQVGAYMKFGIYKNPWHPKYNNITSTLERRYGFSNMTVAAA